MNKWPDWTARKLAEIINDTATAPGTMKGQLLKSITEGLNETTNAYFQWVKNDLPSIWAEYTKENGEELKPCSKCGTWCLND